MAGFAAERLLKKITRHPTVATLIVLGSVVGGLLAWSSGVVENATNLIKFLNKGAEVEAHQRRLQLQAFRLGDSLGFVAFVNQHRDEYLASPKIKAEYHSHLEGMKSYAALLSLPPMDFSALNLTSFTGMIGASQGYRHMHDLIYAKNGSKVALVFEIGFHASTYYWMLGDRDFDNNQTLSDFREKVSHELNRGQRIGLPKYELARGMRDGDKNDIKLAIHLFQTEVVRFLHEVGR